MSFFQNLFPNTPSTANLQQQDETLAIKERILQFVLVVSLIVGMIALTFLGARAAQTGNAGRIIPLSIAFAFTVLLTLLRKLPYTIRAHWAVLIYLFLGISVLLTGGLSGNGRPILMVFAILAAILLSRREGVLAIAIMLGVLAITGWMMNTGRYPTPQINVNDPGEWLVAGIVMFALVAVAVNALISIISSLDQFAKSKTELASNLEAERTSLEERVKMRTLELQRRATQMEAASRIARDISTFTSLDDLLNSSVNMIRDSFGFYHAGIFFADPRNEYAVLKAATGEAGRTMLERGHKLRIGETGIVGFVVSKGQSRIALNVGDDAAHFKNPILPNTRSELALPLQVGSRVLGALDVQSEQESAFSPEDVKVLQTIADQLAVAIDKAQLVQQLAENVEELERGYRQFTSQAWATHLSKSHTETAYRYNQSQIETAPPRTEEVQQVLQNGKAVIQTRTELSANGKPITVAALPIQLRGQTLGALDIRFETPAISQDLLELLETASNRLALALENARLIEEIQAQAERERLVSEISTRVRSSSDMEQILRTAAEEIGRTLGVAEVLVQLHTSD